jgi:uncharacterized membrane protein YgcG
MTSTADIKCAFRAKLNAVNLRRTISVAAGAGAIALCAGLTGCAEDPNYPSLSKITDLGSVLTPEERQKAVQDLQKAQKPADKQD